jgi:hypothetical protein
MKAGVWKLLILIPVLVAALSCVSQRAEEPATRQEKPPQAEQSAPVEQPQTEPPVEEASSGEFVVTEELYRRTFDEIAGVIAELDRIIRERDYDAWVAWLSSEYIARTSSREFLDEASKSARLSSRKIVLQSLEDYFVNVVVLSRLQATLDQILFVDEANVKAMTVVNGESYILYWLVREDGRWKIGVVQDR